MPDDPGTTLDHTDPGDDTQLRFRYQHGYGVILLVGAATNALPYVAVWCEHHDDFLGERANGQFDSFQIKTATPENGPWKMGSEPLIASLAKFVDQDTRFPGKFDGHHFVSNVACYDTQQQDEIHKSPVQLLTNVRACTKPTELTEGFAVILKKTADKLGVTLDQLFATCARVKVVLGPSKESFDTDIAHLHLSRLNGCSAMTPAELDGLRDEFIQSVFNASSLAINDPSKHWCCVLGSDHLNPRLRAKRLIVSETVEQILAGRAVAFRFAPATTELRLQDGRAELDILAKKLLTGGLATQLDTMRWRTVSAERHLLALTAQDVDDAGKVINQVRGIVSGACNDALTIASANAQPWGAEMYRLVSVRLRQLAEEHKDEVCRQTYDCLMGMAGLLTEQCEVWWSPEFDVSEAI